LPYPIIIIIIIIIIIMLKVSVAPNPCGVSLKGKTIEEKDFVIKNEGGSSIWFRFGKMERVHSSSILPAVDVCGFIDPGDFCTLRMIASRWKCSIFDEETVENLAIATVNLPIYFYDEYPRSCKNLSPQSYFEHEFLQQPVKSELLIFEVSVPIRSEENLEDVELILRVGKKAKGAFVYPSSGYLDYWSDSSTDSGNDGGE
jgi:hypothetical protein